MTFLMQLNIKVINLFMVLVIIGRLQLSF